MSGAASVRRRDRQARRESTRGEGNKRRNDRVFSEDHTRLGNSTWSRGAPIGAFFSLLFTIESRLFSGRGGEGLVVGGHATTRSIAPPDLEEVVRAERPVRVRVPRRVVERRAARRVERRAEEQLRHELIHPAVRHVAKEDLRSVRSCVRLVCIFRGCLLVCLGGGRRRQLRGEGDDEGRAWRCVRGVSRRERARSRRHTTRAMREGDARARQSECDARYTRAALRDVRATRATREGGEEPRARRAAAVFVRTSVQM